MISTVGGHTMSKQYDFASRTTTVRCSTDIVSPEAVRELRSPLTTRLVCVAGIDLGQVFEVGDEPVEIGRAVEGGLLLSAVDVSRRHAVIKNTRHGYVVEDLGSLGGTFINGTRLLAPTPVAVGDRIHIGPSTVLVLTLHDRLEAGVRQLQEFQRMAMLVSGVAHDFRNALQVISSSLECLASDEHGAVADARLASRTATALAEQLINIGRLETLEHEAIPLAPLVADVLATARRVIPDHITMEAAIDSKLVVGGAREDYTRVIHNLLVNARDAMPAGGAIRMTAERVHLSTLQAASKQLMRNCDYVMFSLTDTGVGMTEETLARLFDPYFTTKPTGVGTGLGLAVVHSIVRRHEGCIEVESQVGRGSTFRIWFPMAPREEAVTGAAMPAKQKL